MCAHIPSHTHKHLLACSLSLTHLTKTLPYVCAQQMCLGSRLRVGSAKFAISINERTHTHAHTGDPKPTHTSTPTHTATLAHR